MTPIRHQDPIQQGRKAHAPYNFVRLPDAVLKPPEDRHHELDQSAYSGFSGYFEITLENSSPLYTRGMLTPEQYARLGKKKNLEVAEKNELAPFFSIDGRLHIPGSSLRGLFRTLIEIVSFSKPHYVTDEHFMYRSVDTSRHGANYRHRLYDEPVKNQLYPRYQAGYIHRDGAGWFIRPAVEVNGTTFARVSHRKLDESVPGWREQSGRVYHLPVFIKPGELRLQQIRGGFVQIQFMRVEAIAPQVNQVAGISQSATLVVSGPMDSKESEAVVFALDTRRPRQEWIEIPHKLVASYKEQSVPEYQGRKLTNPDGVLQEGHPVFYLMDGENLVSFGHCPMMRIPYLHSPHELLAADFQQTTWPDLAERIFGYVKKTHKNDTTACAGRVFFEDADWQSSTSGMFENDGTPVAPKILSNPKVTTFQHYLAQPQPDDKEQLLDYDDPTILRGHKLYWARGPKPAYIEDRMVPDRRTGRQVPAVEKYPNQYTRIQPLKPGNRFKFRIRFDNLTPVELGALWYVIQLGRKDGLRLRLGMGKPLGLGAIGFPEVKVKLCNRTNRYSTFFTPDTASLQLADGMDEPHGELEEAQSAFEAWVMADASIQQEGKTKFEELWRIRELLRLLAWPGPNPQDIEYMTDLKEFQQRKVLPGPLAIALPKPEKPTVVAVVSEVAGKIVWCEIQGQEDVLGQIDKSRYSSFDYREGNSFDCEVLEQRKDVDGGTLLILRPIKRR